MSKQNWKTPSWLYDQICELAGIDFFDIDAAADGKNNLCIRYYTEENSGLAKSWDGNTFCNPPFCDAGKWVDKALHENIVNSKKYIFALVLPVGCSQRWYHALAEEAIIYIPNIRISFLDPDTGKPSRGADRDTIIAMLGGKFVNRRGDGMLDCREFLI
jgi:phage N-6-adenine-methyltransferase